MKKKIKLILYIRANGADTGPPLGTVLGNIGVSTVKFCKEFNEFTGDLSNYFVLKTKINIEEDRNFNYTVESPSIGSILSLLKKEENIKTKDGLFKLEYYIFLEDIIKLAKFKFPYLDLKRSIKIIKGSLHSSNIKIKI
jgi:ribosomal protein L11